MSDPALAASPATHDPPYATSVVESLVATVAADPVRIALQTPDRDVTYRDLLMTATRVSESIRGWIDDAEAPRIVVAAENSWEVIAAYFGIWLAGGVVVPVDPRLAGSQLPHVRELVRPQAEVLDAGLEAEAKPDGGGGPAPPYRSLEDVVGLDPSRAITPPLEATARVLSPRDPALILLTSGTTGRPKGVEIGHRALAVTAAHLSQVSLGAAASDRVYCPWSVTHSAGLRAVIGGLLSGSTCVLRERFDPDRFWEDVRTHGVTLANVLGASRRLVAAMPSDLHRGRHRLRRVYATPSYADAVEQLGRVGVEVVEGYGLTETGQCLAATVGVTRTGSIGRPVPYYDVALHDQEGGTIHAADEVGEIAVRPHWPAVLFLGYVGDPGATLDACRDLWFHTGDLGYRDEAGDYHLVGRKTDTIRRSSEMISAISVEAAVGLSSYVAGCAVWPVPDPLRGEEICAAVVLRDGGDPQKAMTAERLDAAIRDTASQVPASWVPRYWYVAEASDVVTSDAGRIRKADLAARMTHRPAYDRTTSEYVIVPAERPTAEA